MFDLRRKRVSGRRRRTGGGAGEAPAAGQANPDMPAPGQPIPGTEQPAGGAGQPAPAPAQTPPVQQNIFVPEDKTMTGADVNKLLTAVQNGYNQQLATLSQEFDAKLQKRDQEKEIATQRAALIGQVKADPALLSALSASDPEWEKNTSLETIQTIANVYGKIAPKPQGRPDIVTPNMSNMPSNQAQEYNPEALKEKWAAAKKKMLPGGIRVGK